MVLSEGPVASGAASKLSSLRVSLSHGKRGGGN